jgi:beta-galactosidase
LYLTTPAINQKIAEYVAQGGILIVGPASGTKDWHNVFIDELPPLGKLKEVFGCELIGTGSLGYFGVQAQVTMTTDAPFAAGKTFECRMMALDQVGFFNASRPAEILRPTTAQAWGHYANGQVACTSHAYGQGLALYLGFSPDASFMQHLIGWLTAVHSVQPLLATPAGVEVTQRGEVIFVVNHNFFVVTVELPQPYHDLLHQRELQGNVLLASQHTLVLMPVQPTGGATLR